MEKEPLISIVVLNYNAGDLLINCVESLKKSSYHNFEILIVDNISSDNCQTKCKEKFPDITMPKTVYIPCGPNLYIHARAGLH